MSGGGEAGGRGKRDGRGGNGCACTVVCGVYQTGACDHQYSIRNACFKLASWHLSRRWDDDVRVVPGLAHRWCDIPLMMEPDPPSLTTAPSL